MQGSGFIPALQNKEEEEEQEEEEEVGWGERTGIFCLGSVWLPYSDLLVHTALLCGYLAFPLC